MKHKIFIFDFDGTLVDSMPTWSQKMLNILQSTNTPYPDNVIKIITPLGDKGTARYFKEDLGVPMSEDEMFALMDEYALPKYRDEIPLKESVEATLKTLKEKGCSLNVLTASPHKMVDCCLERLGIYSLFDNVWTCEDFGLTKSNPEIYVRAAQKLGANVRDIAFFDDNIGALETAKKADMFTVGVYDKSGEDFTEKLKAVADVYIKTFGELDI